MRPNARHARIGLIISVICLSTSMSTSRLDAQSRPPILVSEEGVGRWNGKTESSVRHIAALFPGFKVVAATDAAEGIEFPTVEVRDGRTVWLEILPEEGSKGIRLIMVKTDKIKVPG